MLRFFFRLGFFGLFLLSALDSSFLVLPFSNDLLLIALVSRAGGTLKWIVYVIASVLGSIVGVSVVDVVMRKAGEKGLERFLKPEKIDKFKKKIENKSEMSLFVATVLPPPFPFTPVIMTASALQMPRRNLFATVLVARLVRFTIEALLALYFGRKLIGFLRSDVVTYLVYGVIALGIVLSTLSVITWLRRRKAGGRIPQQKNS
jgi:membrane protein YqaA with SNARE-associated domain